MRYNKVILFSVGLVLCGCGTQKIVHQSSTQEVEHAPTTRPTPILYAESTSEREQIRHPKVSEEKAAPEAKVAKTAPMLPVTPSIKFTSVESANIRVPGNNPLPAGGELVLDLDMLKQDFCYPYPGKTISNYGRRGRSMHTGVDIKAVPADTIRAVMPGVVRMSKSYSGYGNVIVIRHNCGVETVYSHQLKNLVQPNDVVHAGQAIGLAGRTGRATTEHVHFELRAACETIDPSKFLDYDKMSLRDGKLIIRNSGGKLTASNSASGSVPMAALEPATKVEPAKTAPARVEPTAAASKPAAQPSYHTVRKGDTLSAIARAYSTTVAAICKINNIEKDGVLSLGQRIRLR